MACCSSWCHSSAARFVQKSGVLFLLLQQFLVIVICVCLYYGLKRGSLQFVRPVSQSRDVQIAALSKTFIEENNKKIVQVQLTCFIAAVIFSLSVVHYVAECKNKLEKLIFFNAAHFVVVCSRKKIGKRNIDAVHSPRPCSTNARHEVHSTSFGEIYVPQKEMMQCTCHLSV